MSKKPQKNLPATSFTEVQRLHQRALVAGRQRSIVMTASTSGEGVSTLAHIMATRSADTGVKTLLVDLNLKNKGLTQLLGFKPIIWDYGQRGGHEPLASLARPVEGVPQLFFMAAPEDLETVQALKAPAQAQAFFAELLAHFDQVIVDTSPCDALNRLNVDPVLLAAAADETIVVLLAGRTPVSQVKRCVAMLQEAGARLSGVLVNDKINPSLQVSLLRAIDRLSWLGGDFTAWLRKRVVQASWLAG